MMRKSKPETKLAKNVAPHSCPCCEKCWIITEGPNAGTCIYGGPFSGYDEARQ